MKVIAVVIMVGGYLVYLTFGAIGSANTLNQVAQKNQCAMEEYAIVTGELEQASEKCKPQLVGK